MAHDHDHDVVDDDFEYEDVDIKDALGLPDALPPIRLLPLPELAAQARTAPVARKLAALAEWVGKEGREVDDAGDLTPDGLTAATAWTLKSSRSSGSARLAWSGWSSTTTTRTG